MIENQGLLSRAYIGTCFRMDYKRVTEWSESSKYNGNLALTLMSPPHVSKKQYGVDSQTFWNWVKNNLEYVDLRRYVPLSILPEPEWLHKAIEYQNTTLPSSKNTQPWSEEDDRQLDYWYFEKGLSEEEIGIKLERSKNAIVSRIPVLWKRKTKTFDYIKNNYGKMSIEEISQQTKFPVLILDRILHYKEYHRLFNNKGLLRQKTIANALGIHIRRVLNWSQSSEYNGRFPLIELTMSNSQRQYVVDPYAFWNWVKQNLDLIDLRNYIQGSIFPEPSWLHQAIEEQKKHYQPTTKERKKKILTIDTDTVEFIKEHYGRKRISYIAEKTNLSVHTIRQITYLHGFSNIYENQGFFTRKSVKVAFGIDKNTVQEWHTSSRYNGNLPFIQLPHSQQNKGKRVIKNLAVDGSELWEWVRQNLEFVDLRKYTPLSILPEPEWLSEALKYQQSKESPLPPIQWKKWWTKEEEQTIWNLYYQKGLNYEEIGQKVNRTAIAVEQRLQKIREMKRNRYTKRPLNSELLHTP